MKRIDFCGNIWDKKEGNNTVLTTEFWVTADVHDALNYIHAFLNLIIGTLLVCFFCLKKGSFFS